LKYAIIVEINESMPASETIWICKWIEMQSA
jgi:hypothetical protein